MKNPTDNNLIKNKLKDIEDNGCYKLKKVLGIKQKFKSNIVNSNTYFYKKKNKLEIVIEQEGICTI